MTLNQLYHFLSVVNYSSITKAASKLYISHSAISRSISDLESEFNVQLFLRDGHNLVLTEEGFLMVTYCKKILGDIDSLKADMERMTAAKSKALKISLPSLDVKSGIFSAINKFRSDFPDVSLAFEDLDLDEIEDELISNKLDLAVTYSFITSKMNLSCYQYKTCNLFREDFCALLNNDWDEAKLPVLNVKSLRLKHPLVLKNASTQFMETVLPSDLFIKDDNPKHWQPISLNSIILGVINGTGWACLPECIAQRFSSLCSLVPLDSVDTSHYVTMCWKTEPRNRMLEKLAQTIIDKVKS
jgi:DNA-binding transcriptional LysR family regulator